MTRIQTKDLAGERTESLVDKFPLPAPWTLYIDVTNRCNFKCVYCPTGNPDMLKRAQRYQRHMPMEMYKKIIEDMKEFPHPVKIVNLYKDGEPLVNKNLIEMIHILKDANVAEKIYSKTNGALIPKIPDLAAAPLDMLGLSVPHVNADGFKKVVGKWVDYKRYVDGVRQLYEDPRRKFTINAKIARYQMTDEDIEKFFKDFEPICDTVAMEGLHGWGAASEGNMFLEDIGTHDGSPFNEKLSCPLPMYMMSISSDGTTNVCCAEWGNFHNLGNVMDDNIFNLWNNDKRREFQIMHLEGRLSENAACKDCQHRASLPLQDSVDANAQEMLKRIKR